MKYYVATPIKGVAFLFKKSGIFTKTVETNYL